MITVNSYRFDNIYEFADYFRWWLGKYGSTECEDGYPPDAGSQQFEDFCELKIVIAELGMTAAEVIDLEPPIKRK